jgi:hypothetical protein
MISVSCGVNLVSVFCPSTVVASSKFQGLLVVPLYSILAKTRHLKWSPLLGVLGWSFETHLAPLLLLDSASFH